MEAPPYTFEELRTTKGAYERTRKYREYQVWHKQFLVETGWAQKLRSRMLQCMRKARA